MHHSKTGFRQFKILKNGNLLPIIVKDDTQQAIKILYKSIIVTIVPVLKCIQPIANWTLCLCENI